MVNHKKKIKYLLEVSSIAKYDATLAHMLKKK